VTDRPDTRSLEERLKDARNLTPVERINMVWELTRAEWPKKDPDFDSRPMRKDITRVIRRAK
jgi:hypothetical protein